MAGRRALSGRLLGRAGSGGRHHGERGAAGLGAELCARAAGHRFPRRDRHGVRAERAAPRGRRDGGGRCHGARRCGGRRDSQSRGFGRNATDQRGG